MQPVAEPTVAMIHPAISKKHPKYPQINTIIVEIIACFILNSLHVIPICRVVRKEARHYSANNSAKVLVYFIAYQAPSEPMEPLRFNEFGQSTPLTFKKGNYAD